MIFRFGAWYGNVFFRSKRNMGAYVNPGTTNFEKDINDDFYVDKSMLIKVLNAKINRRNCYYQ